MPIELAVLPANNIASRSLPMRVPILMTNAWLILGTSTISSMFADINGDAPNASKPLALKFAATMLVML